MAATKKRGTTGATSEDTTTTTPPQGEVAAKQANEASNDDVSVDALANGQLEVNLLDLGVSAEDIAAMCRIDARIEEARRAQQQALDAEPSEPQMTTRAKGKQTMLTEAERQEQYNKLREEELRCKAMQEKLRAQRLQLEKLQAPPPPSPQKEMNGVNPRQQEPPRFCPKFVLVEEISDHSESDGEEPYQRRHQKISPPSEELEEVQWPHRLNPAILPQFDGNQTPNSSS